ncbi:PucR C-terminal helix-turn-helix domain-containing protein [Acetitomaculum ruminis DSM 5522]|uniref:PucR C-terminal helix-turn-helix domain-containing protein n=1 Tax=Acetitomaculum ruminis DSM 5522 TaxID=1120918 RepID=A0A1I0YCH2_9FIRM|nr:helix-turn-helix domain-containing protein [Acetitomaculum ruminis]SFB10497.1 PucR C-terminal helix-turn-helix domain-containing protein [Acetitomaculum ruminis DSM 5522]
MPTDKKIGFKLNMQIFVDEFNERKYNFKFINKGKDPGNIVGARLYKPDNTSFLDSVVYIARNKDLSCYETFSKGSFIIIGEPEDDTVYYSNARCIIMSEEHDLFDVFNIAAETLDKGFTWDRSLQSALGNFEGVDSLCKLSMEYFGNNPLFVHDAQFFKLSCPIYHPAMLTWVKDDQTGQEMIPISTVNEFKIDPEYLNTLETRGAHIFSEHIRGYRILYVNIWADNGKWLGRLCIDELITSIKPGQYLAAEYLTNMIKVAFERRNIKAGTYMRPFDKLMCAVVEGKEDARNVLNDIMRFNGWKLEDEYLCIKIGIRSQKEQDDQIGIVSTCSSIEAGIKGSHAFTLKDSMVVVVDLTMFGKSVYDFQQEFALIIREGLFKAGVSETFRGFDKTGYYYKQACIAYEYGVSSNSMEWCFKYREYALDYILDKMVEDIPYYVVCSPALEKLERYDKDNETELFKTLETYLENERNAVHTAKALFIHRSTLFYRLDRIKEITGASLEDADTRLYLMQSFKIYKRKRKNEEVLVTVKHNKKASKKQKKIN